MGGHVLIKSFILPSGEVVPIPPKSGGKNRLTMLLGVNGTQKSTLLRGFLDQALREITVAPESATKTSATVKFYQAPSRVIALSAIPNDRFPTKMRVGGSARSRYEIDEYEYIGPRHNQNIISRNQSLSALVSAVLTNRERSPTVTDLITMLCERTTIPTRFTTIIRGDISSGRRASLLADFFDERSGSKAKFEDIEFLKKNNLLEDFISFVETSTRKPQTIEVDLISGMCYPQIPFIDIILRHRLLSIRRHMTGNSNIFNPDDYSAGQWGLFSSIVTLALKVTDNSLILIDEPESALHPSWQRDFVDCLSMAVDGSKGCHIVIATHSPLLIGSAGGFSSELIILRRHATNGVLWAEFEDIPEGWQSNDILELKFELESTRGTAFVAKMDELLKLVARGAENNASKIKKILKEIEPILAKLPEGDQVRSIVSSVKSLIVKRT
ncbi:ATP-binding protein [Pseudomonas helmanticensis]|uniref:ATP-binding protein n=1 Tax=Pseudomonas helmanticensis TaxID=1471381 RepID=UPI00106475AA|nr:ATP-binding protein [Pseudomonas helmanticensis]